MSPGLWEDQEIQTWWLHDRPMRKPLTWVQESARTVVNRKAPYVQLRLRNVEVICRKSKCSSGSFFFFFGRGGNQGEILWCVESHRTLKAVSSPSGGRKSTNIFYWTKSIKTAMQNYNPLQVPVKTPLGWEVARLCAHIPLGDCRLLDERWPFGMDVNCMYRGLRMAARAAL